MFRVSIIIPNYNKEKFIRETLISVKNQSYNDWECIIIDDHSTDSSVEVISEFLSDNRFRLILRDTIIGGGNVCRNIGVRESKGEYLVFLDSDDLLDEFCLENRMKKFKNYNDEDFLVFSMGVFHFTPNDLNQIWYPNRKKPLADFLEHNIPWQTMQPIWKKEFFLKQIGFDEQFDRLQDVEFHTRVLFSENVKFKCFNTTPDCYFRIIGDRRSFNTFLLLGKWSNSMIKYYTKFYDLAVSLGEEKKLLISLFRLYLQFLTNKKSGTISKEEFLILEKNFFSDQRIAVVNKYKIIYRLTKFINSMPFHIKGVNYILSRLLLI